MLTKKVKSVPIDSIQIPRAERQRKEIDVSDILESIRRRGVLTPICITESGTLIFGERRLTAAKQCGHTEILARIAPNSLSELDLQTLELEENLMRAELPWQDKAAALAKMFALSGFAARERFAESIGYSPQFVHKMLSAHEEIQKGNERVANAPGINKAVNVITRQRERVQNNVLSDILDTLGATSQPEIQPPRDDILLQSFIDWAPVYTGPKFNLLHCDFPYGIDLDQSDQLQVDGTAHATYMDTAETFWALLETLTKYKDQILSHSAHMIFWHSMKEELYLPMRQHFHDHWPEWTFEDYPLIWLKSDNRGIAPDVERRPRRIYETALFGWRGERKLVKLASNGYAAPKEQSAHPSTKPEPVLRHFFQMVVDHNTRLLDPTCGSGTALRAAESLGAPTILGLEVDPDFHSQAVAKLRAFRATSQLAKEIA